MDDFRSSNMERMGTWPVNYQVLSDAVGILETRIVTRHWVTGCDGIAMETHEEARPLHCLVWIPNEVRDRPAELRLILALTLARRLDVGLSSAPGLAVAS